MSAELSLRTPHSSLLTQGVMSGIEILVGAEISGSDGFGVGFGTVGAVVGAGVEVGVGTMGDRVGLRRIGIR